MFKFRDREDHPKDYEYVAPKTTGWIGRLNEWLAQKIRPLVVRSVDGVRLDRLRVIDMKMGTHSIRMDANTIDASDGLTIQNGSTTPATDITLDSSREILFQDANLDAAAGFVATHVKLSDTAADWEAYKATFGETASIIGALTSATRPLQAVYYVDSTASAGGDGSEELPFSLMQDALNAIGSSSYSHGTIFVTGNPADASPLALPAAKTTIVRQLSRVLTSLEFQVTSSTGGILFFYGVKPDASVSRLEVNLVGASASATILAEDADVHIDGDDAALSTSSGRLSARRCEVDINGGSVNRAVGARSIDITFLENSNLSTASYVQDIYGITDSRISAALQVGGNFLAPTGSTDNNVWRGVSNTLITAAITGNTNAAGAQAVSIDGTTSYLLTGSFNSDFTVTTMSAPSTDTASNGVRKTGNDYDLHLDTLALGTLNLAEDFLAFGDESDAENDTFKVTFATVATAQAGDGLTATNGVFAVNTGTGLTITGDAVLIDTTSTVTFGAATWDFSSGTLRAGTPLVGTDVTNKTYVDNLVTGISWKPPVTVFGMIGERTVAQINALTPALGDSVVAADAGTPSAGSSDLLAAGDIAEYDGTSWKKIVANSGGVVPAGIRVVVSTTQTLQTPFVASTDEGRIVVSVANPGAFNGTYSDWDDTGDAVDGNAVLVQGAETNTAESANENLGYVFDGAVPTGSWVQFTGAGQISAGAGLDKTGNTLFASINTLGAGTLDVSADSLAFLDATDSVTRKATLASLVDGSTISGAGSTFSVIQSGVDHGSISGLADDDHTQYALLAGRDAGQTLNGGTATSGNLTIYGGQSASATLTLESTSNATKGTVIVPAASTLELKTTTGNALIVGTGSAAGDIIPSDTGIGRVGTSTAKFLEVNALTVTSGDHVFNHPSNGGKYRITEHPTDGLMIKNENTGKWYRLPMIECDAPDWE